MRDRHHIRVLALALAIAVAIFTVEAQVAEACGCLSPPAVTEGDYAVNQRAEQIIFEVEPGWVTAHVLIKYAGAPEQFAWIIPVPELPELGISPVSAFGLIDRLTAPDVGVDVENICPISAWACAHHDQPSCGGDLGAPVGLADGGASSSDAGAGPPPVTILDEKVVGDYQTVTFRATEAAAATQWLRDNGFIVNQTTSIYMDPYVQANMVFVAVKLVSGAGISAIKPLRMRFRAAFPMIPLVLTAVAAEPHLTVSAFVYADQPFRPMGHPVVTIDRTRIAQDGAGRTNYPMVLARTIDEAGGDGFAIEYRGGVVRPDFGQSSGCCGGQFDFCGLGGNGLCECPRDEFDLGDCNAKGDLVEGVALVDDLATRHSTLTRITTRVSAEEMNFDPTFEPHFGASLSGRMVARGEQPSLSACRSDVIDESRFAELDALQGCASVYCGVGGQCVATAAGAGCACGAGTVSQRFVDLDNQPSVTCVPTVPPVDLRAGGLQLPDACADVSCGMGRCLDRNGVAVCECDGGAGAVPTSGKTPRCEPIGALSQTPGAQDFSEAMRTLDVCAPPPPSCGNDGWLVRKHSPRPGIDCGNADPAAALTVERMAPRCDGFFGCGGCQEGPDPSPLAIAAGVFVVALLVLKRRRTPSRGQR